MKSKQRRPITWVGGSKEDLSAFPRPVKVKLGFALHEAQSGKKHRDAKPLKGFGGSGVLEIISDHGGDTYRGVYTVRFEGVVYVLHVFQKKSKHGIATPKRELDLVKERLKWAERDYENWRQDNQRK
jgi:phage-related protein